MVISLLMEIFHIKSLLSDYLNYYLRTPSVTARLISLAIDIDNQWLSILKVDKKYLSNNIPSLL